MRNFFTAKNLWQQDITFKERTKAGMKTAGMIGITAWLYYRRVWAAIFLILPGIWLYREFLEEESKKKEQEFQKQFREMIQTLSSALNTGYSVENAFYETQKELKIQYPEEARISRELLLITRKLRMHIPVEQVLEEFAERVPSEDVKSFVTVFVTAKKSGGDMIGIIRNTTSQIGDKIEVKREIDTLLAAKKYEFQIMSMVPYGIIAYMSLSFSDFMEELYGNVTGIGVMTLCLGIYVGAYYLGVGALLSQNLRKGTKGLSELLKLESIQAFEERKARAKRLGEEAGTKLLLPMFLMLVVVLIIVIVPAFLTMQI